jgi:hypothetical protein
MSQFGKHSPRMYTGSMVGSGAMTFAVMGYCLANARIDEGSELDLNPPLLAATFGEPIKKVVSAIEYLQSPDPCSRTPDHEGRRIVHVGPGPFRYKVVNLQKYRDDDDREYRVEYWRQHKAWTRNGRKGAFKFSSTPCPQVSTGVHISSTAVHPADPDPDPDPDTKINGTPVPIKGGTGGDNPVDKALLESTLMNKVGGWFGRRPTTKWGDKEIKSLKSVVKLTPSESDIDLLERYYAAIIPQKEDYRRRDIVTLLNNWNGELDRARRFKMPAAANSTF